MSYIKITGFKTFPEMRKYENTAQGREHVYEDLLLLTGNDILSMDCADWCELAQIGESYESYKFIVEILDKQN